MFLDKKDRYYLCDHFRKNRRNKIHKMLKFQTK